MCAQISDEVILSVTKLHLLKKHGQDVCKVLSGERWLDFRALRTFDITAATLFGHRNLPLPPVTRAHLK